MSHCIASQIKGHWNDMDMLIVGTTTNTNPPFCSNYSNCSNGIRPGQHWTPMSVAQSRAQVSMWTILKSPLLASADFNTVAQEQVDILTNDEVLAVSDDPLGKEVGAHVHVQLARARVSILDSRFRRPARQRGRCTGLCTYVHLQLKCALLGH